MLFLSTFFASILFQSFYFWLNQLFFIDFPYYLFITLVRYYFHCLPFLTNKGSKC